MMLFVTFFYIYRFITKGENSIAQAISIDDSTHFDHSVENSTGFFFAIMFR
jgi:hypothetical protein